MDLIVQTGTLINLVTNAIGGILLAPVAILPGWVSITVISAILGVLLLLMFKYTSNQKAISRIRDDIKADLLAVKLFKDSIAVTLRSQVMVLLGSFRLLFHSIIPMLVMIIPVCLILAQMGLWYQARPLNIYDEPVVVKLVLDEEVDKMTDVNLRPSSAYEVSVGPVRVLSKGVIFWKIKPLQEGYHNLTFHIGVEEIEKQLAVGEGFMRLSLMRPGQKLGDMFFHPLETPFDAYSQVQSISIDYPDRNSMINGTDWWFIYFFIASMIFAFVFKPLIKVRI